MNPNEQILQELITNLKPEFTPSYDPSSNVWFFLFVFIVTVIAILCFFLLYKLIKKITFRQYRVKKQTIALIKNYMKNLTEENSDNFLSFINVSLKRMILTLNSNQALNLNGAKWVEFLSKQLGRKLQESECKAIDLLGNNSYQKITLNQEQIKLIKQLAIECIKKYSVQTNHY